MINKQLSRKLKIITDRIIKDYQPEKIILFGSAVSGRMYKDSDFDITIIKNTKKRFYDRIGEVLHIIYPRKQPIGVGADIIVYTPEEFSNMATDNYFIRDEIIKKGKVLYEKYQQ